MSANQDPKVGSDKSVDGTSAKPSDVSPEKSSVDREYNVYSEPIDPKNNMPLNPNQLPRPGQKSVLDTTREVSSIPKGGTDSAAWQYPSQQMFFNALKRKGKGDDVDEEVVADIVAIHNNMNERTWRQVQEWEALHQDACPQGPRLSRFKGRPDDLSPIAFIRHHLFRQDLPFDRHDWVVDRCGREVRYVIDYYHDEAKGKFDQRPTDSKTDFSSVKSISVFARPAVDSFQATYDRFRMPVMRTFGFAPNPNFVSARSALMTPPVSGGAGGHHHHGAPAGASASEECPVQRKAPAAAASEECPVQRKAPAAVASEECPVQHKSPAAPAPRAAEECPVQTKAAEACPVQHKASPDACASRSTAEDCAVQQARPAPPPVAPASVGADVDLAALTRESLTVPTQAIFNKCGGAFRALHSCDPSINDGGECQAASVSLFHCMSSVLCPKVADAYASDPTSEPKYDAMVDCVGRFEMRAAELVGAEVAKKADDKPA